MNQETTLLQALKNHETRAQSKFYDAHLESMKRICFRILHDELDAEDAVQIGFTKFFKNIHLVEDRGKGCAEAYLKGVIRQEGIAWKRKMEARAEFESAEAEPPAEAKIPEIDFTIDALVIPRILKKLTEKHRTILTMCMEGFADSEIAEKLGIPEKTVSSELFRARKQFLVWARAVGLLETPKYNPYSPMAAIEQGLIRDQWYYTEDNPPPGKPVAMWFCIDDWTWHKANYIDPPPGVRQLGTRVPRNLVRINPPDPNMRFGT